MNKEQEEKLIENVADIRLALLGNPEFKQEGLIHEVRKNSKFRKNGWKIIGVITGVLITAYESIKEGLSNIFS